MLAILGILLGVGQAIAALAGADLADQEQGRAESAARRRAAANETWAFWKSPQYQGPWAQPIIRTMERTDGEDVTMHRTYDAFMFLPFRRPVDMSNPLDTARNWTARPPGEQNESRLTQAQVDWRLRVLRSAHPEKAKVAPFVVQWWLTPKGQGIRESYDRQRLMRWNPATQGWERYTGPRPVAWAPISDRTRGTKGE